jgi:hypothetical protein
MNRLTILIFLVLVSYQGFGQEKKTDYKDILPVIDLWLDAQKDFEMAAIKAIDFSVSSQ